jgi:hypothetical protein
VPGIIDSPFNHVETWDLDRSFRKPFPELRGMQYQDVPRGRVLFDSKQQQHIIYLGRDLMNARSKELIAEFFGFDPESAAWKIDVHYTTNADEIGSLLDDSEE